MVLLHTNLGRLMVQLYLAPGLRRPVAHLLLLLPTVAVITVVITLVMVLLAVSPPLILLARPMPQYMLALLTAPRRRIAPHLMRI